ncbi:MAG TPA: serine/threonine-protein kinase [Phycisphaerae bacterium]|nr:serine/threonine-protein kinase [Phycisphaerae bacterium]
MSLTRWRKTKDLFLVAAELDPTHRSDYLDTACAEDPALRAEVESLLAHHETDSPIEPPGMGPVAHAFTMAETQSRVGRRAGAYELLRLLGAGGMGHVYLAQRADGQFEKQVAVKVIRCSLQDDEVLRRFRIEQKTLASLEHPNIARLIDGGMTEDGLSYLVMEYIEGAPIDQHCRRENLSLEKRLQLFRLVCDAVHFAHQHLVVHRDLKPANILVTPAGQPKLLDFGIAKLLDEDTAGASAGALTVPFLTPEYASPEQIRGEPITTASDIYSLGVVLYELLTDTKPYRLHAASQSELTRQICDVVPDKPSTVIQSSQRLPSEKTQVSGDSSPLSAVSRTRRRKLAGDLDNICLMALRKEPQRRYGSVEQFSEDIRRHLSGLPVIARRDTFTYRAGKFIRRNKAAVVAATLFVLALFGGVVGTSAALVYVRQAEKTTDLMNDFLRRMLAEADVDNVGRDLTVREMLDRASGRVGHDFEDHPDVEAGLRSAIGNAYLSLGLPDAEPHLRAAYETRKRLHGDLHPDVAESLHNLAVLAYTKGNLEEAEGLVREALEIQRKLTGEIDEAYAAMLDDLAVFLRTRGDFDAAEPVYRRALALNRHLFGPSHVNTAQTLNNYAVFLKLKGDLDAAEQMYRKAVEIRRADQADHHGLATSLSNLAVLLQAKGDYGGAEPLYREALALQISLLGDDHPALAITRNNLAMHLLGTAKFDEAAELLQKALETTRRHRGEHHPQYATVLFNLGTLSLQLGRFEETEPLYRQAYETRLKAFGRNHTDVATSLAGLGVLDLERGNESDAGRRLRESLAIRRGLFPKGHAIIAQSLDALARLALASADPASAEAYAGEALDIRRRYLHKGHPDIATSMARLAAVRRVQNRCDEAAVLARDALELQRTGLGRDNPAVAQTLSLLAEISRDQSNPKKAREYVKEANRVIRASLSDTHPEVRRIKHLGDSIAPDRVQAETDMDH